MSKSAVTFSVPPDAEARMEMLASQLSTGAVDDDAAETRDNT